MQGTKTALSLALLVAFTATARATTVLRCEDAQGRITYSQHGCPSDQLQQLQDAHNPRPSGSGPTTQMTSATLRQALAGEFKSQGIGQKDDGCGNQLDSRSRRESVIKGKIRAGMTRADVESALGKPERVSGQNGTLRFHYQAKNGRSQQVTFDENGCVKKAR